MFDFLRNLTKSAEEKRQEQLHAYVSNSLSDKEKQRFETLLEANSELQAEVDGLMELRQMFRQMPQRRAPRHFTLDPAVYGKPAPRPPLIQLVPAMRMASVLTAVFLMIAIGADVLTNNARGFTSANVAMAPAQESAAEVMVEEETAVNAYDNANDTFAADTTTADVTVEVDVMETEMVEEEAAENADTVLPEEPAAEEAPPVPQELSVADEEASDAAEESAPEPENATDGAGALPTPTPDTPRLSATETEMAHRSLEVTPTVEGTAVALVVETTEPETAVENETMTQSEAQTLENDAAPFLSPLRIAQIGLLIMLIGLLMLLRYARMLSRL